jgi:hypothetical protein
MWVTLGFSLSQMNRLSVFKNKVPRMMFGSGRDEVEKDWKKYTIKSFIIPTLHLMLF